MARFKTFLIGLFVLFAVQPLWADTLYFSDSSQLKCQILDMVFDASSGITTFKVRVSGGVLTFKDKGRVDDQKEDDTFSPSENSRFELNVQNWILSSTETLGNKSPMDFAVLNPRDSFDANIKSIKGWAFTVLPANGDRVLLDPKDKIKAGDILETAQNSRLTLDVEGVITVGLKGGSRLQFHQAIRERDVGLYDTVFDLQKGEMWLEIQIPSDSADRVKINCSGLTYVTTYSLQHLFANKDKNLHLALFKGEDLSLQYLSDGARISLSASQEVFINNQNKPEIMEKLTDPTLEEEWANWKKWQPLKIEIEPEWILPKPPQADLAAFVPALGGDEGIKSSWRGGRSENLGLSSILKNYKAGLEKFKKDVGEYPTPEQGLKSLKEGKEIQDWNGPYVDSSIPNQDSWGSPFAYRIFELGSGQKVYDLHSIGPNKKDNLGLGDDLR